MSLYELVFIPRQEVSPVRAKELAKKINEFVSSKGGKVKKEEYWGFKNLSYQIKKIRKGHYLFFILDATASAIPRSASGSFMRKVYFLFFFNSE